MIISKIKQNGKSLSYAIKEREKTQIIKIHDENGNTMPDTILIQNKSYNENLFSNKIDNFKEFDRFLETNDPTKLNQKDI